MKNNDVLRRIRYVFDFDDSKMMMIFGLAGLEVTRAELSDWLKREDDTGYRKCSDLQLSSFLNGLIIEKRGKKDGPPPEPETLLNNNMVFRKLNIALNLQANDVLSLVNRGGLHISKHELSAFFRRPGHKHYRECKDQVMRNFLSGLQQKHRGK